MRFVAELSLHDMPNVAGDQRVLRARRGWQPIDVARLWRFRDLLWLLALRDIQVRYKQAALGAVWAVIQPLVLMIVFRTFLGRFTGRVDPVELFCVLVPWMFFAATVTAASNSLVGNAELLRKVYFPRLIAPLAAVGAPLLDFGIAFVVLFGLMGWFGTTFSWQLAMLPLLVGSTIVAALGGGILMASLTVTYRDFRFVVPFAVQLGFFLTPVIYPISMPA
ncbi:MAG: phosphate ABC transporter permease, partial [Planctomycetaceae bacterium]|nr:phosphate ABC transporter permease [Planctomycetaceae bacterium]